MRMHRRMVLSVVGLEVEAAGVGSAVDIIVLGAAAAAGMVV